MMQTCDLDWLHQYLELMGWDKITPSGLKD